MYLLEKTALKKLDHMTIGPELGYIGYPTNMLGSLQNYFFERFKLW
jgi:hypothetical protein